MATILMLLWLPPLAVCGLAILVRPYKRFIDEVAEIGALISFAASIAARPP